MDQALVIEASLKATGADIHEVTNLISAYHGAHQMSVDARSPAESSQARTFFAAAETALRAFMRGMPAKMAVAMSEDGVRHGA